MLYCSGTVISAATGFESFLARSSALSAAKDMRGAEDSSREQTTRAMNPNGLRLERACCRYCQGNASIRTRHTATFLFLVRLWPVDLRPPCMRASDERGAHEVHRAA